jgi:hypothetical protein
MKRSEKIDAKYSLNPAKRKRNKSRFASHRFEAKTKFEAKPAHPIRDGSNPSQLPVRFFSLKYFQDLRTVTNHITVLDFKALRDNYNFKYIFLLILDTV